MKSILAFDIVGTKTAAGLVNDLGQILERVEALTPAARGAEAILEQAYALGRQLLAAHPAIQLYAVGAASAGQIDAHTGRVKYATPNLPGWSGLELAQRLHATFRVPAVCDNDVNAMALAELSMGAGQGLKELLCVMVGTGIGGAVVSDGRVMRGNGGVGEIGHITLDSFHGRRCNCGGIGCLETYASSRALLIALQTAIPEPELQAWAGKPSPALTITDLAELFTREPSDTWRAFQALVYSHGRYLGQGLASAANLLNPERIVIGGSIQAFGEQYLRWVTNEFSQRCLPATRATEIVYSQLGQDAALLGIARLAWSRAHP